jgi:pimeloyl-ACP methyl ester carboxylesterase
MSGFTPYSLAGVADEFWESDASSERKMILKQNMKKIAEDELSSYNLFEKSGHFPMVEEQELFDKKLIEWIKRH